MKNCILIAFLSAVSSVVVAQEPICDTMFTGELSSHANAWKDAGNWTHGLPADGQVACVPDVFQGILEVPHHGSMHFVGSGTVAAGEVFAACCVNSSCVVTTPAGCENQNGHFLSNVTSCFPATCQTGACCDGQANCTDRNAFNQPMTQLDCEQQGWLYRGGAHCNQGDPCGFQQIPEGYEIIDIVPPELQPFEHRWPKINHCGEVIFHSRFIPFNNTTIEVYYYENGKLVRLTSNQTQDVNPDINDDGVMGWMIGSGSDPTGQDAEVQLVRDGHPTVLGLGGDLRLNNTGSASWNYVTDPWSCEFPVRIHSYNGESTQVLFEDGLSNQGAEINDLGWITWTNYISSCPCCSWTSTIRLFTGTQFLTLPSAFSQPQVSSIDNLDRVAWGGTNTVPFEVYQNAVTQQVAMGRGPALNDRGDIAYYYKTPTTPYQMRLIRNGMTYRLSTKADVDNGIDNNVCTMNNDGEVVWGWSPNGGLAPSGIRMLRRIRTGDIDLDGDVDRADFGKFPGCYTGSVETDRLCECRFLDTDHDRDVDDDDYALFLQHYNGPLDDCNNNGVADFDDILYGPALDCNRNGIPDSCDIAGGHSPDLDGNGIPDDCVYDIPKPIWREIFPVWTNRFLTMIPRNEGKSVALKVTLTSLHHVSPPYTGGASAPFTAFEGAVRWVGPPVQYVESTSSGTPFWAATLQCAPHYQVWDGIELLHVTGREVVPSSEYHVQTVSIGCTGRESNCAWESEAVRIKTSRWGDVETPYSPPSATVQPDLGDVGALVNKFRGLLGAPIKVRSLIAGSDAFGNFTSEAMSVDFGFGHIAACVNAFRGGPYPGRMGRCATGGGACSTNSDCTGTNTPPCNLYCP